MLSYTSLLVEFLIAGLLVLYALILLVFGILPGNVQTGVWQWLMDNVSRLGNLSIVLILPMISLAYAIGILSELATRNIFDWIFKSTDKGQHLADFFEANRNLLTKKGLFKKYDGETKPEQVGKDASLIGEMRFAIMLKSERLYKEIEAQLNRLRILRVLFVFWLLLVSYR